MKLADLTPLPEFIRISGPPIDAVTISGLCCRAQDVVPGDLFAALPGTRFDGHDFIQTAIDRGAAAIMIQADRAGDTDCFFISNSSVAVIAPAAALNVRTALARIAARFYGHPARDLRMVGITGTNGKTTTTYILERILTAAGFQTGVMGTIQYRYGDIELNASLTTPEALDLHRMLWEMRQAGVTHLVMEASSHALSQDIARLEGCCFDLGVFTNFSQDHLDYHQNMEDYWRCKKRLFTHHLAGPNGPGTAVINIDDPKGRALARELTCPMLTVGHSPLVETQCIAFLQADVTADVHQNDVTGISARIHTPVGAFDCRSALSGRHNLENLLCAVGAAVALSLPITAIKAGIESLTAVPGRLERVAAAISDSEDKDFSVFVDYAHTPDALENVLTALRPLTRGRLICVFGCGGDRDRDKRPKMGRIATALSDLVVVTSDNPRSEPPMAIIDEILPGIEDALAAKNDPSSDSSDSVVVESDRRKAIFMAIESAQPGDVVLIAGKGHETYQILGDKTIDFNDRQIALEAMASLKQRSDHPIDDRSHAPAWERRGVVFPWTGADILKATNADLLCGDPGRMFDGVSIDSRNLPASTLFLAICGERHDAHKFLPDAVAAGCRGLLVEQDKAPDLPVEQWRQKGLFVGAVKDGVWALGDLAAFQRRRWGGKLVSITGSNGKTTTRRMTSCVMSQRFAILSTQGNFNNIIGLPLTLLGLTSAHEWAVVEMGMNAPGEIKRMAQIAGPDIGVITNIGPAHLEGLGSMENITAAKAELLEELRSDGTAILNADDPRLLALSGALDRSCLLFGTWEQSGETAVVRARDIQTTKTGVAFTLETAGGHPPTPLKGGIEPTPVSLAVYGDFMVGNALAAAAVGLTAGMTLAEIAIGLSAFRPVQGRMTLFKTPEGVTVMDDTYNANPGSMNAALKTLAHLKGTARGFFVAGDMYELGDFAQYFHRELGKTAAESGIAGLFAVGAMSREVLDGAAAAGMAHETLFCGTHDDIIYKLKEILIPGDWVLVKGSRAMKMETIIIKITER